MSELLLQNEDNLNSLIVNFNNLIKSFSTLSRDKIENVLLTANSIMNEGEDNIRIMEEEMNKLNLQQQFGNKLKNYKLEFQNLQLKFNEYKDKYINKKANNAINLGFDNENFFEDNKQKTELITDGSNDYKFSHSKNEIDNQSDIIQKVEIQDKFSKENNLNNSLPDLDLNVDVNERRNKKIRIYLILIIVGIFILIILIGILILYLSKDDKNNKNLKTL
jgi:hypothetical protein